MHQPGSFSGVMRVVVTMIGDVLITWIALFAIVTVRTHVDIPLTQELMPPGKFPLDVTNVVVFAGSAVLALALSGHYDFRLSPRHRPTLFVALPLQIAIVAVAGTLLARPWPRTVFMAVPFLEAFAFLGWRRLLARLWRERPRSTVIVGGTDAIQRFLLDVPPWLALSAVVSVDQPAAHPAHAGTLADDRSAAVIRNADEVIDAGGGDVGSRRLHLLALRGPRGFAYAPSAADALVSGASYSILGPHLLAKVSMPCGYGVGAATKRMFDVVAGSLLLILSLPLLGLGALVVALDGRGRVLLRQERAGLRGRTFLMWKLRTMHLDDDGADPATDDDHRVTRVGRWLRRYRIDELPQLLNVVRGDMSLVGPRPEIAERARSISKAVPHFDLRLLVRPGLAGLAQTSADYDQSPEVKLTYDLQYLCSWSLGSDIAILMRALVTALSGRGV